MSYKEMSMCENCGEDPVHTTTNFIYCQKCGEDLKKEELKKDSEIRRRGLTDHEALKLEWYRDDKKWQDNIRSRKIVEKNGQKTTLYKTSSGGYKELPSQPKKYWKNDGKIIK